MPGKERATVANKTDMSPIAPPKGAGLFRRFISGSVGWLRSASNAAGAVLDGSGDAGASPSTPSQHPSAALSPATTIAPTLRSPVDESWRRDFAFPADNISIYLFSRHPRWCEGQFGLRCGDVLVRRCTALKGTFIGIIGEHGGRLWAVDLLEAGDIDLEFDGASAPGSPTLRAAVPQAFAIDEGGLTTSTQQLFIDPECPTATPLKGRTYEELCEAEQLALVPGVSFDVTGSRVLVGSSSAAADDEGSTFGLTPMMPTPEPTAHAGRGDGSVGARSELHISAEHLRFLQTAPNLVVELDVPYIPKRQTHDDVDPYVVPIGTKTREVFLAPALLPSAHSVGWAGDGVVVDAGDKVTLGVTGAAISEDSTAP
jgi:hypothetical protein